MRLSTQQCGFTLLEALAAMGIATALLGIAVPAWEGALAAGRMADAETELEGAILASGNHAMVTGTRVVLCASSDRLGCNGGIDWARGWIAFADIDGDREHGTDEPILRRGEPLAAPTRLVTSTGRDRIVFQPLGGTPGSNATFSICDPRRASRSRALLLANSGRFRRLPATAKDAARCLAGR